MATQTLTLKLPFLRLNAEKATEFARLQDLNTEVANGILALSREERADLTTAHFDDIEIGSAWMNQTIRNARGRTKVKRFKVAPLETNNQNWTLHKVGDTYSLGFGLLRGIKKRIPLDVYGQQYQGVLDALLEGRAQTGPMDADTAMLCPNGIFRYIVLNRGAATALREEAVGERSTQ